MHQRGKISTLQVILLQVKVQVVHLKNKFYNKIYSSGPIKNMLNTVIILLVTLFDTL